MTAAAEEDDKEHIERAVKHAPNGKLVPAARMQNDNNGATIPSLPALRADNLTGHTRTKPLVSADTNNG